jgi:DinB superfamily
MKCYACCKKLLQARRQRLHIKQFIMTVKSPNTSSFFADLDNAFSELLQLVTGIDEKIINTVPFKGSWTPAQLTSHVTKSNKAIAQALDMTGTPAMRDPAERVEELRSMFLNFKTKFQSPEFIRPKDGPFIKRTLVEELRRSADHLNESRKMVDLSEIISLPAFGEITKLEILHFVRYHTLRHTHQLKNILAPLQKKPATGE